VAERTRQASEPAAGAPPKRPTEDEEIGRLEQAALSEFDAAQPSGNAVALDRVLIGPGAPVEAPSETGTARAGSGQEPKAGETPPSAPSPTPTTITLQEAEQRREQALRDQRTNLEKGFESRLQGELARVREQLVAEAERSREAALSDAERGRLQKEREAQQRLRDELRPQMQAEILDTLSREIGPRMIEALGYNPDAQQWTDATRQGWNERLEKGGFTFVERVKYLHEQALARARTDADAVWQQKLDKALAEQKAGFEKSLAESNGAAEREATSEPRVVGEGGTATGADELERRYAEGTATPEEQRRYERWLSGAGVFSSR